MASLAIASHRSGRTYFVPLNRCVRKAWGSSYHVYRDRFLEVISIEARLGGYSSRHRHNHKSNAFLVARGALRITLYEGEDRMDRVITVCNGPFVIPAGLDHRFLSLEDGTLAYEFYAALPGHVVDEFDIVRSDRGGVLQSNSCEKPYLRVLDEIDC